MKKLNLFNKFDYEAFAKGKVIYAIASEEKYEYVDGKVSDKFAHTVYKCAIVRDNTEYINPHTKEKFTDVSNEGEALNIKVNGRAKSFKPMSQFKLVNPRATIWGEFQNNLSVTADDIEFIQNSQNKG